MASQGESSNKHDDAEDTEYIQYLELYKAADSGDLETVKKFLKDKPEALTASLSSHGDTALHIAAVAGRGKVVQELVNLLDKNDLAIKTYYGWTVLNSAAYGGFREIAEYLVTKNPELISIPDQLDQLPVVAAADIGHKAMVRYLYPVTPKELFGPDKGINGADLFRYCIIDDIYDIPLDLLQHHPKLASLDTLAQKPFAFPSGTRLAFWQQWIYSRIYIPYAHNMNHGDIESPHEGPAEHKNFVTRALNQLFDMVWKNLLLFVPAIKHIYKLKSRHVQSQALLSRICREILTQRHYEIVIAAGGAIFNAVEHGIVEIVAEIIENYPDILFIRDQEYRSIFAYATLQRQENIFRLIYTIGSKKNFLLTFRDKNNNTILHEAAYLGPPSQLDRVSGAALQMQRELQWFKEVESIVKPTYKEMKNNDGKTPQALFTDEHKTLVEKGEKWMKETAESCTVVAALIATIMFAAAFTVPGGYDDHTGSPRYLHRNSFMVFIISDALSFFSSCSSVLMFMEIHTSRYRENDFLKSLPRYLIIGLSSLIFSIATMMVTFAASLMIVLRERISWAAFPIVLIASLPVSLLALPKFPLLVEIFNSTYGPGIFKKPKKPAMDD